jgi:hypothetical protein
VWSEPAVDARDGVVEVAERVAGADDDLVQIICRGTGVVAGVFEVGAELVEGDAGLEQVGLQVAQGLVFHAFDGTGGRVARGVERGLGAETGCGEPEPVGAGCDLGVLVIGDADGETLLPAGWCGR